MLNKPRLTWTWISLTVAKKKCWTIAYRSIYAKQTKGLYEPGSVSLWQRRNVDLLPIVAYIYMLNKPRLTWTWINLTVAKKKCWPIAYRSIYVKQTKGLYEPGSVSLWQRINVDLLTIVAYMLNKPKVYINLDQSHWGKEEMLTYCLL